MNEQNLANIVEKFKRGDVVVFPTDTAFGIGCRMDNERSVRRVFDIKQRSLSNAVLVLVDSVEMAEKFVVIPEDVRKELVNAYWPGGLSIFFKTKPNAVLDIVTGNSNILAVRLPDHPDMQKIINLVGVPIVATSANKSGDKTPYRIEDVNDHVLNNADAVFYGECTYKNESTIVDATSKPWKIIRQGAVVLGKTNEYFKD
ncbi:MAG: threonylcarbamoyl-AMP synthase [Candidatus Levybacteria bacterium]|nr:threonylcarbamoyl-AMP synthase [Candidatus Levybacteria bacterium]